MENLIDELKSTLNYREGGHVRLCGTCTHFIKHWSSDGFGDKDKCDYGVPVPGSFRTNLEGGCDGYEERDKW